MNNIDVLPDKMITQVGEISAMFLKLEIDSFRTACAYVQRLPYGYNADRDDLMALFTEGKGSCTTKHAVIATLAQELALPVEKHIGVYAMTETLVTGTNVILKKYALPYLPMVHCFLASHDHRVDLTKGNFNGKNGPIDNFLYTVKVIPNISGREEYLLYRDALKHRILTLKAFKDVPIKTVLKAREEGLALLKGKINPDAA